MQAREGIKQFGQEAIAALSKEFKQLHDGALPGKPVIAPIDPNLLSAYEKKNALNTVTVIKKNVMGHQKVVHVRMEEKKTKFKIRSKCIIANGNVRGNICNVID